MGAAQPASCTRTQGTAAADARLLAGFPKPEEGKSGEAEREAKLYLS